MKRVLLVLLLLVVLGAAAAGLWFWNRERQVAQFAAAPTTLAQPVTVEVPPGTGPRALAQLLARAGVVTDAELLYRYVRKQELGPKLKAGEYEFTGALTPPQVLEQIVQGRVKTYRFTVPEGLRADEILPIVAASPLKLDLPKLERLASDPAFLRRAGVPADRIEGFLHPDTYTFTRGATEEAVLTRMVARTLEELKRAQAQRAPAVTLDALQAVTLASIVEKETGAPEERPRIACLFHNRLRLGMKLQTDPTVIYAKMLRTGAYSKNITRADLLAPHPYNTYTQFGLPPGPIASPGAAALQAVYRPLEGCKDLYFVSRNDGTHVFCPTLQCHNAAVQKWQVEFFRKR